MKILLIEDIDSNRDMLERRLRRHGFEIISVATGREGLKVAEKQRPDLILLDIGLPEMDGLQVTRELRRNPATEHIPIIAVTAHAMAGDREQCLRAGCDDYAAKPVELPRLLAKIRTLVPDEAESPENKHLLKK